MLQIEKGRSNNTLLAYRRDLTVYQTWLETQGVTLRAVDAHLLGQFVEWLRGQGKSASTVARTSTTARSLHRFLVDEGISEFDPGSLVEPTKVPPGLPKPLSVSEVTRLIESCGGNGTVDIRDRALLELLYGCGLRISEAVRADIGDVSFDQQVIVVTGKGAKQRRCPLGRCALEALARWLDDGRPALVKGSRRRQGDVDALFVNQRGGRLTRQGGWLVLSTRAQHAGLGDKVSPHVLRHSCATHMLEGGADIRTVQEMLGHASLSTTQVYTRVMASTLREAYHAAHPRAGR
jgi:integrase/recombinase XerD